MKYIICYDITEPKRLVKVAKTLEKKGYRIQKSFFSLLVDEALMKDVQSCLIDIIDRKKDKVAVYPVCDRCIRSGVYIGCTAADFFEKEYFIL